MRRAVIRAMVGAGVVLVAMATAASVGHHVVLRSGLERLREAAEHRLDIVSTELDAQRRRFDYLPSLLEMTPGVFALLDAPRDDRLRDEVNRYLHGINVTAGAANLYVLDRAGIGLAASDWDDPGTPVGFDLSFRPYVQEAAAQGHGQFFGVGMTSKRAGYYLSYALNRLGDLRGVAIVKIDLGDTERAWGALPGVVLLADERDVSILSSHPPWRYRPLAPLSPAVQAEIARSRPYGSAGLTPLAWRVENRLDIDSAEVALDDVGYLVTERRVNQGLWRLLMLDDTSPAYAAARLAGVTAALAAAVVCLLAVTIWQRRRALRQRLAGQAALQAAHDSLETRIAQRTAELRAAQNELVHAGKLAALGQMSAGMVHELNQPLAALRTLSDNACVLLDKSRPADARANLERIGQLVDRLGRLTRQLKAFAHKTDMPGMPIAVRQAIANAQLLVSHGLKEHRVEVDLRIEPPALTVIGDGVRLEQVLVNLFNNAIDAMTDAPARHLSVAAEAAGDRCVIAVDDTGPGIRADVLPRLFDPFVTTKPAGRGLGLGLMISAHIVREFGGSLRASNPAAGGARFVIDLPAAPATQETPRG